ARAGERVRALRERDRAATREQQRERAIDVLPRARQLEIERLADRVALHLGLFELGGGARDRPHTLEPQEQGELKARRGLDVAAELITHWEAVLARERFLRQRAAHLELGPARGALHVEQLLAAIDLGLRGDQRGALTG